MEPVTLTPIGRVVGGRTEPRDDRWADERAVIELDAARFGPDAVAGLDEFSHVEVVFVFDRVAADDVETGARHPRGNEGWPRVGVFAQRAKDRPNRLGVSVCELRAVDGLRLEVQGLDAIDGTPVLDVKPVMHEFQPRGIVRQPAWVRELMREYWRPLPPRVELQAGDLFATPEHEDDDGDGGGDGPGHRIIEITSVTDDRAWLWLYTFTPGPAPEAVDPSTLELVPLYAHLGRPTDIEREELDTWELMPVRRLGDG